MEIILARTCKSITGSLGKSYGYSITKRDGKFYSIRSPKGPRIRDGHLRFIFACTELARDGFLIADIDIRGEELLQAAREMWRWRRYCRMCSTMRMTYGGLKRIMAYE